MIDHQVAAALGAIPAVTQLAGVEFTEKLRAFANLHSLGSPQREDADRRRAITPALVAMTVTHVRAAHRSLRLPPPRSNICLCASPPCDGRLESGNQETKKIQIRNAGSAFSLFLRCLIFARQLGSRRALV